MAPITRREFLARSLAAAATVGAAPLIASCTPEASSSAPRPGPVTAPIAPGLEPESGPLTLFNWEQYMSKSVLDRFSRTQSTEWNYITFFNADEAVQRIASENFDVAVMPAQRLPALIQQGLIQPLNEEYLGNISNVWPRASDELRIDPAYAVPYTVGKVGVAWSSDRVGWEVVWPLDDPYDMFWMEELRNSAVLPGSYEEGIALGLRRAGVEDLSTGEPGDIERAKQELLLSTASVELEDPVAWLVWSGDVLDRPGSGNGPRFAFGRSPLLVADAFVIPSRAAHPVLAHAFIDHMLTPDMAFVNSRWLGYRQPVDFALTYGSAAGPEYVTPSDIQKGFPYGPKDDASDSLWRQAWDEVLQALS